MLHTVKKVEYLEGYKLRLHFNDKRVKVVDLESMIKKAKNMFVPLVDLDYFKKVKCDGTTICWPNGVDLCPDVLYAMGKDIFKKTKSRKKASPAIIITRKKSKSRVRYAKRR